MAEMGFSYGVAKLLRAGGNGMLRRSIYNRGFIYLVSNAIDLGWRGMRERSQCHVDLRYLLGCAVIVPTCASSVSQCLFKWDDDAGKETRQMQPQMNRDERSAAVGRNQTRFSDGLRFNAVIASEAKQSRPTS